MALYFLSCDLRKDRDYPYLYDALRDFNAVRLLESTWCFNKANTSSKELCDYFKGVIDPNDRVVVSEISGWASFKTDGTPNDL